MKNRPKFIVIVDDANPKKIIGFTADVPLPVAFAVLAADSGNGPAPFDLTIKTASEIGLAKCDHPECNAQPGQILPTPKPAADIRTGKMDRALRSRGECPVLPVTPAAGPLADMLSILSDQVATKKGGR